MFIIEIRDEGQGGGETEDEPSDDPVEYGPVLRVLNPLNLVITRKRKVSRFIFIGPSAH